MSNINVMIIGLGGSGCNIVNEIAKYHDSQKGGIPKEEAFIFIDSHQDDLNKLWANIRTKKVTMRRECLSKPDDTYYKRNPWIPKKLRYGGQGIGMSRVLGKAYYDFQKDNIGGLIKGAARDLQKQTANNQFLIIIVSALGGGTGSGIMPDLSLDIKYWINEINNNANNNNDDIGIFGIGILPSHIQQDMPVNKLNAMAALKELHFLLSIKDVYKRYHNPFKMFILVGRDIQNEIRDSTVQDSILNFLVDLEGMPGDITNKGKRKDNKKSLDLNDLIAYLEECPHLFSTIGYNSIEFPENEMRLLIETEKNMTEIYKNLKDEMIEVDCAEDPITKLYEELKEKNYSHTKKDKTIQNCKDQLALAKDNISIINYEALDEKEREDVEIKLEILRTKLKNLSKNIDSEETKNSFINQLKNYMNQIKILIEIYKNLDIYKNELIKEITQPSGIMNHKNIIKLDKNEINLLMGNKSPLLMRNDSPHRNFLQTMEFLDRYGEYNQLVNQPYVNLNIFKNILLNYDHQQAKITDVMVSEELANRGFITINKETNTITEQDVRFAFNVLRTDQSNFQLDQLNSVGAQKYLKNYAVEAEIFPLYVSSAGFKIKIYNLWIGLNPWVPAFSSESRLKDIDKLKEIYDTSKDKLLHHSLFLGDFEAFQEFTKIKVAGLPSQQAAAKVINFWENYNCEDLWSRVPLTIAKINKNVDILNKELESLQQELELMKTFEEAKIGLYIPNLTKLDDRLRSLDKRLSSLSNYKIKFEKEKDGISGLIPQLVTGNIDGEAKTRIKDFLTYVSNRISELMKKINELEDLLNNEVKQHLDEMKSPHIAADIKKIGSRISKLIDKFQKLGDTLNEINNDMGNLNERLKVDDEQAINIGKDQQDDHII